MESLKNWGLMLLFISAGSLIYCFLLPGGSVSKTARAVISACVIISLALPLADAFGSFHSDRFRIEEPPEINNYSSYFEKQTREVIEDRIQGVISRFTSVSYKTEILIDIDEMMNINIGYVKIVFSAEPQKKKELSDALFNELGIMPDIRAEYASE